MYTTDRIFTALPTKNLVNQDIEPNMPHKLATGTKPSLSNPRVLFCPCVLRKVTEHVYTKELNVLHQSQKIFQGILFLIKKHQKGYLIYVYSTRKIVSSHDVTFDETFLVCYHTRHIHIHRH